MKYFVFTKPAAGIEVGQKFSEADFDTDKGELKRFGGLQRLLELQVIKEDDGKPVTTGDAANTETDAKRESNGGIPASQRQPPAAPQHKK